MVGLGFEYPSSSENPSAVKYEIILSRNSKQRKNLADVNPVSDTIPKRYFLASSGNWISMKGASGGAVKDATGKDKGMR